MFPQVWVLCILLLPISAVMSFNVVLAGGTGPVGQAVAAQLSADGCDKVWVLTRNAFLAATPTRATEQFGWMGAKFLQKFGPTVQLRDWDGGDLLDIVGQDWVGWQQDVLPTADVVVHLVGGFTPQRVAACERLVRECRQFNPTALHITVSPTEEDMGVLPPTGAVPIKTQRVQQCEQMVAANCLNSVSLRLECCRVEQGAGQIVNAIQDWTRKQQG